MKKSDALKASHEDTCDDAPFGDPMAPAPFTAQDLVDAIHAAIDAENTKCEAPARTEPVARAADARAWGAVEGAVYFVPRAGNDAYVDVLVLPNGKWDVWDRDEARWLPDYGVGLDACVEACLDALDEMGVL